MSGVVAPAIANPREGTGRVKTAKRRSAAKGSLDAPKRSRTIVSRSDGPDELTSVRISPGRTAPV